MRNRNKGVFLFVPLAAQDTLLAGHFWDVLAAMRVLDVGVVYEHASGVIDFALYLLIFIPLAQATLAKQVPGREGKMLAIAVGLALSLSLTLAGKAMGFGIRTFGPLAAIVLVATISVFIYRGLRAIGVHRLTAACAAFVLMVLALQAAGPGVYDWMYQRVPWISLPLVAAVLALCVIGTRALLRGALEPGAYAMGRVLERAEVAIKRGRPRGAVLKSIKVPEFRREEKLKQRLQTVATQLRQLSPDISAETELDRELVELRKRIHRELDEYDVERVVENYERVLQDHRERVRRLLGEAGQAADENAVTGVLDQAQAATKDVERITHQVKSIKNRLEHLAKTERRASRAANRARKKQAKGGR